MGTKPICGTENSDSHKVGIYVTCLAKDADIIQIYVSNIFNMHICKGKRKTLQGDLSKHVLIHNYRGILVKLLMRPI